MGQKWMIQRTKHPSSHNIPLFTVAKPGAQVKTSAGNSSKCKLQKFYSFLDFERRKKPKTATTGNLYSSYNDSPSYEQFIEQAEAPHRSDL